MGRPALSLESTAQEATMTPDWRIAPATITIVFVLTTVVLIAVGAW
jgi:hypothetical protein